MRKEIEDTLKQARADFDTASANINIGKYYASVFFSQQTAEKALKALYMQKLRTLLRTHTLVELCDKLKSPEAIKKSARRLNHEYVTTRYVNAANGVPAEIYDEDMAKEQLKNAEVILKWVENSIKE